MRRTFTATLEDGHKGPAVIVPFDPAQEWGIPPVSVYSAVYGKEMPGHPVRGTIAGRPFTGWIGRRWGRFFVLVDEDLCRSASLAVGSDVEVVLSPARGAAGRKGRRPPRA